ncbi:MAG: FG-GAP-like repeat-containing protein [Desulfuromonadales bacterium]
MKWRLLVWFFCSSLAACGGGTNGASTQDGLTKQNQNSAAAIVNASVTDSSIAWYNSSSGSAYGMTTNGSSITGGTLFWQEPDKAWTILGRGDFDGDGIRDLVWWNSSTGQVYLMLMSSPTAVKSGAVIYTEANTNWRIVATGDINGDGKSDLIWWNKSTGQVYVMLLNGTAISGGNTIYTEPDTNWKIVAAADFNGNGKAELLWWNSSTGQTAIGQTNGTSTSTADLIWTEPNTDWRIAGAGDLDGDGKAEIIWHNKTTGQVYGMQTNGSSVTSGTLMYTESNTNWEIASVGDYNSDGKADLLWWNQLTGQVYLMPMNGMSVGQGGALLYTEADTSWKIQGETAFKDKVYGNGVVTGTTVTNSATYSISGLITCNGTALSGVTVTLSRGITATTDASGNYTFTGNQSGNYTITPTLAGYVFTPASISLTVSNANVTGKNFTASNTGSITVEW